MQERFDRLMALQERISTENARRRRSVRIVEVLVEGGDKKGVSTQARTRTNRIVHLPDALEPGIVRPGPDHRRRGAPPDG